MNQAPDAAVWLAPPAAPPLSRARPHARRTRWLYGRARQDSGAVSAAPSGPGGVRPCANGLLLLLDHGELGIGDGRRPRRAGPPCRPRAGYRVGTPSTAHALADPSRLLRSHPPSISHRPETRSPHETSDAQRGQARTLRKRIPTTDRKDHEPSPPEGNGKTSLSAPNA